MRSPTLEEELKIWSELLQKLRSVPNDMRSRNHTNYISEVEMRVYEINRI